MEAPCRPQLPGNVCSAFDRTGEEKGKRWRRRGKREGQMGTAGRLRPGSREKRHIDTGAEEGRAGQEERAGEQAEDSEGRGETRVLPGVQFLGPRTGQSCLAPAHLVCQAWPGISDSRGGVSEGKGTRADTSVDILVQGQIVSLLQVQEEEPVRGLAWVEALVLQPRLLDLEGACGVHLG